MAKRHLFSYFVPDVCVIGAAKSSVGVIVADVGSTFFGMA